MASEPWEVVRQLGETASEPRGPVPPRPRSRPRHGRDRNGHMANTVTLMRISKEEGLRMALALDTAITCMEDLDAPLPASITKSLKQDSLIHLRTLRSAALRANRDAPGQDLPYSLISGDKTA